MIHFFCMVVVVVLAVTILASLSAYVRNLLTIVWLLAAIYFQHLVTYAKIYAPAISIALLSIILAIVLESPLPIVGGILAVLLITGAVS